MSTVTIINEGRPAIAYKARQLMEKYGSEYDFDWNTRKTAFGVCHHGKETIFLSVHMINRPMKDIIKTILHEIAHELVRKKYALAQRRPKPHGKEWKRIFADMCIKEGIDISDGIKRGSVDNTLATDARFKYHIVLDGNELTSLQRYVRKPSKRTFQNIDLYSFKSIKNSKGNLKIITRTEFLAYHAEASDAVDEAYKAVMGNRA